jgi:pimeloyl-ACP methyl ester carboxylesterase
MRRVSTPDGRTLAVSEGGDPAGVPVLVHSGTPNSRLLYEPHVRDAEEEGIRLFSYDRPGYGGSTRKRGRDIADCATDVAAVCDALGVDEFCVWGVSGGGPHALATAALLPERVRAAGVLASVAPFDAAGLDFYGGMGKQNAEDFRLVVERDDEAHLAMLERERNEMLSSTPEQLVELWQTLLGPADRGVLNGELAAFLIRAGGAGIGATLDGWFDEDLALTEPWGFDLAAIRAPVLLWHGEQDQFVPFAHGLWLAEHVPGVEARLTPDDGHLTLSERRVPEVHAWLLERARLNGDA